MWGLFLLMLLPLAGMAQDNRLINTRSWHYEYIQRLQQRGHLLELNPTDLPYTAGDIRKALENVDQADLSSRELRWYEALAESVADQPPNVDGMRVGGVFEGMLRHSSSERLNVLRPLGEGKPVLPRGSLTGYLEWENWIGQAGATFDWFYDIDPDGLDVARRLYMRSEEAYFGYNGDFFDVHIGRFDNHWSEYDRQGSLLTDNPRSFDQLQLKFGNSRLSFSSILGELDSMNSDSTYTGRAHELGSFRRYLFLHRLDWSPVPHLKLTFFEGELYYSATSGISLRNLFPLHFIFFESHNKPMNNESNMILGGSIWYQSGPLTIFVQGMLDDLVVGRREPLEVNKRNFPPVYTINSSLSLAEVSNNMDLGLEADLVSSNSYRSSRYQDQWTYMQRGLATNFSDYIQTKLNATFYPGWLEDLQIESGMAILWQGAGDMRELRTGINSDGSPIPGILSGTVERTIRPSLYLRYQPVGIVRASSEGVQFSFWMDVDMGMNFTSNYNGIEGEQDRSFTGLFRMNGRILF